MFQSTIFLNYSVIFWLLHLFFSRQEKYFCIVLQLDKRMKAELYLFRDIFIYLSDHIIYFWFYAHIRICEFEKYSIFL